MKYDDRLVLEVPPEEMWGLCRKALEELKWNAREEDENSIRGTVVSERWSITAAFILAIERLSAGPRWSTQVTVVLDDPRLKEDLFDTLSRIVAELFFAITAQNDRPVWEKFDIEPGSSTSASSKPVEAINYGSLKSDQKELTSGSSRPIRMLSFGGEGLQPKTSSKTTVEQSAASESKRKAHLIFISYRHDDSPDITGRINDRLVQHFGSEAIFKDDHSIPLGVDFRRYLEKKLKQTTVLLAIIGNSWAKNRRTRKPRLDDSDYVRLEIATALERDIPVIPLLVGNARFPPKADLPEDLQGLYGRQRSQIRSDPDFHNDMNRLIKELKRQAAQAIEP